MIDMAAIRDDGGQRIESSGWSSPAQYFAYLRDRAAQDSAIISFDAPAAMSSVPDSPPKG
jgi:hypothetical protein